MSNNLHTQHLEETIARLEAEAQALREEVAALRARAVVPSRELFEDAWVKAYKITLPEFHPSQHRDGNGYRRDFSEYIGSAWVGFQWAAHLSGKMVGEGDEHE